MGVDAVTPAQRDLALWLLEEEMGDAQESEALLDAAERACQKLCRRLAKLVTVVGYQALLARALHLARGEFPFLEGVRPGVTEDACFDGLRTKTEGIDAVMLRAALTTVLAQVIGLVTTFIGDALTLRLVRDVWPDAPFGGETLQEVEEAQS
jgi:hypothetical protein